MEEPEQNEVSDTTPGRLPDRDLELELERVQHTVVCSRRIFMMASCQYNYCRCFHA